MTLNKEFIYALICMKKNKDAVHYCNIMPLFEGEPIGWKTSNLPWRHC